MLPRKIVDRIVKPILSTIFQMYRKCFWSDNILEHFVFPPEMPCFLVDFKLDPLGRRIDEVFFIFIHTVNAHCFSKILCTHNSLWNFQEVQLPFPEHHFYVRFWKDVRPKWEKC